MTIAFSLPNTAIPLSQMMIVDAARCWREAREKQESLQPCLANVLARYNCAMLTPVLDSLFLFYETGLGRSVQPGGGAMLSEDEYLLLGLLDGSRARRACIDCAEGVACALDCAICSTRIMLAMVDGALVQGSPRRRIVTARDEAVVA